MNLKDKINEAFDDHKWLPNKQKAIDEADEQLQNLKEKYRRLGYDLEVKFIPI